jgi:GNAT superfamily N-acetyltransferase
MVLDMTPEIRPYEPADAGAVVRLALRAWEPVFASIQAVLGKALFDASYPRGWAEHQREAVESALATQRAWVAVSGDRVVGFITVVLHADDRLGEIHMVAVDPDRQSEGIGTLLTARTLAWMRDSGMTLAMVETGADPGHAAARRTYERAGFAPWPAVRYFKMLDER